MNQKEEIAHLKAELQEMRLKAESYAIFGDLMKTMAMLPLTEQASVGDTAIRVHLALMLHGIPDRSREGQRITAGLMSMLGEERESLIASFLHTDRLRTKDNGECTCPLCEHETMAHNLADRGGPPRAKAHYGATILAGPLPPSVVPHEERMRRTTDLLATLIEQISPRRARGGSAARSPLLMAIASLLDATGTVQVLDLSNDDLLDLSNDDDNPLF